MSIRSRLSITGPSLSTVSGTWSAILRLASRYLVAFLRRCAHCPPGLLESEGVSKAALPATERSWSAMGLPAYFQQAPSFEIVKLHDGFVGAERHSMSTSSGDRKAPAGSGSE